MFKFKKDGPSSTLSLPDLTIKTAMLLALIYPCRGADLAEMDLSSRPYVPEEVVFTHTTYLSNHPHHIIMSVSFFLGLK